MGEEGAVSIDDVLEWRDICREASDDVRVINAKHLRQYFLKKINKKVVDKHLNL